MAGAGVVYWNLSWSGCSWGCGHERVGPIVVPAVAQAELDAAKLVIWSCMDNALHFDGRGSLAGVAGKKNNPRD